MKLNKLFLTGAIALGLVACKNNDAPEVDAKGNTFAKMSISMVTSGTRAVTDGQEDYEGRGAESKFDKLDLVSTAASKSWIPGAADADGAFWKVGTTNVFTVAPWKTEAGNHSMALLLNKGTLVAGLAPGAEFGEKTKEKDNIATLSTEDKFVMTTSLLAKTITEGITADQAKNGTAEAQNVFDFDAERVVAQGMMAKAAGLTEDTKDGKGKIDLEKVTYSAVNGAVKTFLYRNNAGDRTMAVATPNLYAGFKSAIDGYTEFKNAQDPAAAADYLIRLGNIDATSNDNLGGYKAIPIASDIANAKSARGIYFLENSVDKAAFTKENKDYGFYRMAYAKVYATFSPNKVMGAAAGAKKVLVEKSGTGKWYLLNTTTNEWEVSTSGTSGAKEGYVAYDKLAEIAHTAGTTFYKGAVDDILYADKIAAQSSQLAPNQKIYTYTDGRCGYRALWNRQADGTTVTNADARRNNVYLLTIESFQGLGMPWDPSDPKDPNLPKPTDPEEGGTPDNPDIEKEETYMRVTTKVLQWNLVSRNVNLD